MKKVFRSIINIRRKGVSTIPVEELRKNYRSFLISKVKAEDPSFIKLYEWIESHYRTFKELPSIELLFEKANNEGNTVVIANLTEIASQIPYWDSDYKSVLKEKYEEQSSGDFKGILEKTWQVVQSGLTVKRGSKKRILKGINEAVSYFGVESKKLLFDSLGVKIEGQIRSTPESREVLEEYGKRRKDPLSNIGLFIDLIKIDTVFRGIKMGDLFFVAAYVAQGKTTFVMNLAYNGVMQGLNGMFLTCEMPYEEIRDMFYVLHTSYPGWYDFEKYRDLTGKISYEKVRYGELSDEEYEFFEESCQDLGKKEDFGELKLYKPPEVVTPSVLEMLIYEYNAELKERGKTLDFLVLDYVGLMVQDKEQKYGDFNIDLNNMIKKLKNITINFDNGRGLRIISPFQVNRDGWKEAVKNEGVYKLTALSNANEAERSADGIITLFFNDEMKRSGIIKIGCLKNRDGDHFAPFDANIDFVSKKIRDFSHVIEASNNDMGLIKDISQDLLNDL